MNHSEHKNIYRVPFKVRSYEVDHQETSTLSSVCNYFQEAAGLHAHHLNFDIAQLRENGNTWVLYKMHIRLNTLPKRWQTIEVITWPSSGDGLRAFRDYELRDGENNLLGSGISQWMVLNVKTGRPVRMPKEIMEMGLESPPHVIEPDKSQIPGGNYGHREFITTVGVHDLDMNSHVNNVKYIEWITGYLPDEDISGRSCNEIEIQYAAEALKGDRIHMTYEKQADGETLKFRHSLFKNEEIKPIATAFTTWV
ncbi:MAG: hypothetical protein EA390_10835 [Balneolaceae bacterium]|nr:MAG: hypothetical protein EA390_10835 [Balneolaceae bacterium]